MLKTFILLAQINGQTYALDSDMSGADCINAIEAGITRIETAPGKFISAHGADVWCEYDRKIDLHGKKDLAAIVKAIVLAKGN